MVGANEICRMDAVNLARRIRAKELSPTDVIEAVLTRMEALEPHLHAFCTTTPDLARREAKRVEKAILTGEDVGPLAGVPVGIKDLVCTAGIRTVSGSFAYQNFVPDEDDVVVERLKEADASLSARQTFRNSVTARSGTARCLKRRAIHGTSNARPAAQAQAPGRRSQPGWAPSQLGAMAADQSVFPPRTVASSA